MHYTDILLFTVLLGTCGIFLQWWQKIQILQWQYIR